MTGLEDLMNWLRERPEVVFGISSGRNRMLLQEALRRYPFITPDVLICSAGTELYYTPDFIPDAGWEKHINHQWKREAIVNALAGNLKLTLQGADAQWPFKISYFVSESFSEDDLADINRQLYDRRLPAKVLLTDN